MPHEEVKYIDIALLKKGDALTLLRFAFWADEAELKRKFAELGIEIKDETDLVTLAELHRGGADRAGQLKRYGNQPIHFDVKEVLGSMKLSHKAMSKSKIKIV